MWKYLPVAQNNENIFLWVYGNWHHLAVHQQSIVYTGVLFIGMDFDIDTSVCKILVVDGKMLILE